MDRSDQFLPIRLVSRGYEIALVLFLTLAYPIYLSFRITLGARNLVAFTPENWPLAEAFFTEGLTSLLFVIYLKKKGWTVADLRFKPGWRGTREAHALAISALISSNMISRALLLVFPQTSLHAISSNAVHIHSPFNRYLFLGALILNAFFEQIVCMSYAFAQLACKYGSIPAILGTTALRLSYHVWQNPIHLGGTLVAFLMYACWYWYYRNVWPLFLAEIFYDAYVYSPLIMAV